ncbi:MAG: malonic semialdehyde reductase [Pseudomonadota bacterium]
MNAPLSDQALQQLFLDARTHNGFLDRPVTDEQLQAIHELAKWGPTSMNCQPLRLVFVKSPAAKQKLEPALSEGNRAKTMAAPVTAIVGFDLAFHERMPRLFPSFAGAQDLFAGNAKLAETTAFRNGTLQGAYVLLAARALGLACGPMSGFDNAKVDAAFFAGTAVKSNFLINIGYAAEPPKVHPRGPRPAFDEDCRIL